RRHSSATGKVCRIFLQDPNQRDLTLHQIFDLALLSDLARHVHASSAKKRLRVGGSIRRGTRRKGMYAIRRYLLAGFASTAIVVAGAAGAFAGPLELNPDATNGGAGTLDTTCNPCASYPFFTNNSNTAFTADLHVNGTPGTG